MINQTHLSLGDKLISQFDAALRTLAGETHITTRPSPADSVDLGSLNQLEEKQSAGLMRVNHAGEVCAQALYQGQALTAKLPEVRSEMERAAQEEVDHLAWCEQRLKQLGASTSLLNPVWYGLSFGIGAGAGLISDRVSLGFVAATEDQVCDHLENHLQQLPAGDGKSQAVLELMLEDERRHGEGALQAGGYRFPEPVKAVMRLVSNLMTKTSYHI